MSAKVPKSQTAKNRIKQITESAILAIPNLKTVRMKSLTTTLAFMFLLALQAQNTIDLLTIEGRYGLPKAFAAAFQNEKATETGAMINLKIPVKLSEKSIWFSNFTYTNSSVNTNFPLLNSLKYPMLIQTLHQIY